MSRIVVTNSRNPFQLALLAVSAASGLVGLVLPDPGPSNNIAKVFGPWDGLFYTALFVSSLVVVLGSLWPRGTSDRFVTGQKIERAGLMPLCATTTSYAVANLVIAGRTALVAALLVGGIALAAAARMYIITLDLHRVDELVAMEADRPVTR